MGQRWSGEPSFTPGYPAHGEKWKGRSTQDAFGRGGRVGGTERSQVLRLWREQLSGRGAGEDGRKPQHVSPVLGLARSKEEEDARLST